LVTERCGVVTRSNLTRRTAAFALAAALISLGLIARPAAGDEPPGHGHGSPTTVPGTVYAPESEYRGILPPGNWTPGQVTKAKDLVRRTEVALERYDTLAEIQALGYRDFGISAPGGWDHWGNPALNADEHELDPEFPESLVFRRDADGYKLYAAMFVFASPPHTMDHLPEEWAWLPGWHDHDGEFCTEDGTGVWKGFPPCGPGTSASHPEPMAHVWVRDIPECNNRFGGVGTGGVHCGDHGDNPVPECPPNPPYPARCTRPFPPGTYHPRPGGTIPPVIEPPGRVHGSAGANGTARPPTPVKGTPRYTG
jgi:hypothetical protein